MRFSGMKPGTIAYDVLTKKVGEKTVIEVREITVSSCDQVRKTVVGKNQSGIAKLYREADYKNWRTSKPVIVDDKITGMKLTKKQFVDEPGKMVYAF